MNITLQDLEKSQLYSEELGIVLAEKQQVELFKWFLASILFGGRISECIAKNTFRAMERYGLLTPEKILAVGWDFLVNPIMREGGYVRYDGRKSDQLLRNCDQLLKDYGGKLSRIHERSSTSSDLENRLQDFYGIGPVTINIFLRELRPYWEKANPEPLPIITTLAATANLDLSTYNRQSVKFIRVEAGLMRSKKLILHGLPSRPTSKTV